MKSALVERELGNVEGQRALLLEGIRRFSDFDKLHLMLGQLEEGQGNTQGMCGWVVVVVGCGVWGMWGVCVCGVHEIMGVLSDTPPCLHTTTQCHHHHQVHEQHTQRDTSDAPPAYHYGHLPLH